METKALVWMFSPNIKRSDTH